MSDEPFFMFVMFLLAVALMWLNNRRSNLLLTLGACFIWLAMAYWIIIGGSVLLPLTTAWGKMMAGVCVLMTFVPAVLYINDVQVQMTRNGKTWMMYKNERDLKEKAPSSYDEYRKGLRERMRRRKR